MNEFPIIQEAYDLARAFTTLPYPEPLPDPLPYPPDAPISYLGGLLERIETQSPLSLEEQSTLLLDLKAGFREPDTRKDTQTLLKKLRKRRDLLAFIRDEIDELLNSDVDVVVASSTPSAEPNTPYEECPKVFVSYVREDRGVANKIVKSLKENGIDPWLERQSLKLGDLWGVAIEDAISKEADFFIVLLSKH